MCHTNISTYLDSVRGYQTLFILITFSCWYRQVFVLNVCLFNISTHLRLCDYNKKVRKMFIWLICIPTWVYNNYKVWCYSMIRVSYYKQTHTHTRDNVTKVFIVWPTHQHTWDFVSTITKSYVIVWYVFHINTSTHSRQCNKSVYCLTNASTHLRLCTHHD